MRRSDVPPKATVRDVAQLAGVSVATVSYVLNDRDASRARPETRQRVLDAAAQLGYTPSFTARGLRRGRTEQVYVVPRWPGSPFAAALAHDLATEAQRHRYSTAMFVQGDWLAHLGRRIADGAAVDLWHRNDFDQTSLSPLVEMGLALLVFGNEIEPDGIDVVRSNEQEACEQAVRHLVAAGHRRIALLCRRPYEREEGYRPIRFEAYAGVLGEVDERLVRHTDGSWERAYEVTTELLTRPDRPTALFALSDSAGIAASWAAARLGLRVPDDLAIIAVGGVRDSGATGLTFVEPDRTDFAVEAGALFERLAEPGPGRVIFRNWSLVHRGSA
ncbi:LacI family DNA-binding transcriptional regulator [Nonomuraea sp. NPDC050310]|uniref:LacI family DNA-binding transcriptional regulator n=1 Tax=unclassified Nonomuraea TaxID=2593643 RepID=UPI0033E407E5